MNIGISSREDSFVITKLLIKIKGFPGGTVVKNLPAMQETQETWVQSQGREDPLKKEMATHSSILAWKIPWTRSLVGYSPWDHRVGHD